jgi:hypothetical protein
MHVPGVKQEQPDRRDSINGPLFIDMVVRDGNNTRLVKATGKQPKDVVKILNSILRKMDRKGTFQEHQMQNAHEMTDEMPLLDESMFDGEPAGS